MVPDGETYSVFDHVSTSIFVLEVDGRGRPVYAAVNAHALEEAGRPLSDYLGRSALDVYPLAYGRAAYARQCEALSGASSQTFELCLPVRGELRTLRTTLNPQRDEAGRVVRLFGSHVDVTPERNARAAQAEFDTLSSEMEEFVAFAAHDLRAPMKNIAMLANILREDLQSQPPETLEVVDLIENVAAKSMDLIAEVLDRAQVTGVDRYETVFSFPVICHDICATIDPQKNHVVETSLNAIKADRSAVQVALRNLVENAMKHGQRDHLRIEILVQNGMPGMIDITLIDNGRGFSDAALDAMNGGRAKLEQGFGLFGVKRLISARGGTLEARNLPDGGGAAVRFSLPGEVVGADPLSTGEGFRPGSTPAELPRYSA